MTVLAVVVALASLAALTVAGTALIERAYPPAGRLVPVTGGRLHVVERGPADAQTVLLLHGASGNLADMHMALGERLSARYRVIMIDRPGHGWSDRPAGRGDSSPAAQAALVRQALAEIGAGPAIVVGHSWSGALATAYALAHPVDVAGLILLAPVTHAWPGGIGWINELVTTPVIGPLVARTLILPIGYFMVESGAAAVFAPQAPPPDYIARTGARMILRPSEFIANAQDLVDLKAFVAGQAPRYGEIVAPVAIIAGDGNDTIVSTEIHSRAIARQLPRGQLTVLPGVGHMVHHVAAERIVQAIDRMAEAAAK